MRRERGLALILALLLVAAAALLALTAAGRSRDMAMDEIRDRAATAARVAAGGGVERARWALARDPHYEGESVRIGRSDVAIRVARTPDGRCSVVALARTAAAPFAETVTQRVEAELSPSGDRLPRVVAWRE